MHQLANNITKPSRQVKKIMQWHIAQLEINKIAKTQLVVSTVSAEITTDCHF
jgi:hypothetical protein